MGPAVCDSDLVGTPRTPGVENQKKKVFEYSFLFYGEILTFGELRILLESLLSLFTIQIN